MEIEKHKNPPKEPQFISICFLGENISIEKKFQADLGDVIHLLQQIASSYRFPPIEFIKGLIKYKGQQFEQSTLIMLTLVTTSIINHMFFPTNLFIGYFNFYVIGITIYRYMQIDIKQRISTLIPQHYRVNIQVPFSIISLLFYLIDLFSKVFMQQTFQLFSFIMIAILLILDISKFFWLKLTNFREPLFFFESNTLIFSYILMKLFQYKLTGNINAIILMAPALGLINCLKVYNLLKFKTIILFRLILKKSLEAKQPTQQIEESQKNFPAQSILPIRDRLWHKILIIMLNFINILINLVLAFGIFYTYTIGYQDLSIQLILSILKLTIILQIAQLAQFSLFRNVKAMFLLVFFFQNVVIALPLTYIYFSDYQSFKQFFNFPQNISGLSLTAGICIIFSIIFYNIFQTCYKRFDFVRLIVCFFFSVYPFVLRDIELISRISCDILILIDIVIINLIFSKDSIKYFFEEIYSIFKMKQFQTYIVERMKTIDYNYNINNQFYFGISLLALGINRKYMSQDQIIEVDSTNKTIYIVLHYIYFLLICLDFFYPKESRHIQYRVTKIPIILTIISVIFFLFSLLMYLTGVKQQFLLCSIIILAIFASSNAVFQAISYLLCYSPSYRAFTKLMLLNILYFAVLLPFIVLFAIGNSHYTDNYYYLYYYCVAGFFYLAILSTLFGIAVHTLLNLTAKAQRDLFIAKTMAEQMKKLNIQQNKQKILVMAAQLEMSDFNISELQGKLKQQKLMRIVIHEKIADPYDYSLQDPLQNNQVNKLISDLANDLFYEQNSIINTEINSNQEEQVPQRLIENDENINKYIFKQNNNHLQLMRWVQKTDKTQKQVQQFRKQFFKKRHQQNKKSQNPKQSIGEFQRGFSEIIDKLQDSQMQLNQNNKSIFSQDDAQSPNPLLLKHQLVNFEDMNSNGDNFKPKFQKLEDYIILLYRLYIFLSQPSDCINKESFETFLLLLRVNQKCKDVRYIEKSYDFVFESFAKNQQQLTMVQFRSFIIDFTKQVYNMKTSPQLEILRKFCDMQIIPNLQVAHERIKYHIFRKNIFVKKENIDSWTSNQTVDSRAYAHFFWKNKNMKNKIVDNKKFIKKHLKINDRKTGNLKQGGDDDEIEIQEHLVQVVNNIIPQKKQQYVAKKKITFKSPAVLYSMLLNHLIQCYDQYEKQKDQNFKIEELHFTFSNFIAIGTRIIDFITIYLYGALQVFFIYSLQSFSDSKSLLGYINFKILFSLSIAGLIIYLAILFYHRNDFSQGTLGFDSNQRTLTFKSFKFYTTSLIFIFGSSFASIIVTTALNSFLCDTSNSTLYNFYSESCFTYGHFTYMIISFILFIIYYPLALITFPFSSAIDRSLQVKYLSQYQVLYLQFRFLSNGINVIFGPYQIKIQSLVISILKCAICLALYFFSNKMKPCAYDKINIIQPKIYMFLSIINFSAIFCYFFGFMISIIICGGLCLLFTVYLIVSMVTNRKKLVPIEQQAINEMMIHNKSKQDDMKRIFKLSRKIHQQGKSHQQESDKNQDEINEHSIEQKKTDNSKLQEVSKLIMLLRRKTKESQPIQLDRIQ